MEALFKAIKDNNLGKVCELLNEDTKNTQDTHGRTPLIYAITSRSSTELINKLIHSGIDLSLKDKLGDTALDKACKFNNIECIRSILSAGVELNVEKGIVYTSWYKTRNKPQIADLLLETKGAVRLTLNENEQKIIDELIYGCDDDDEDENPVVKLYKLNSPELIHSYVLHFNWDDDIEPIKEILQNSNCLEITAIEMFELADGDDLLTSGNKISEFEQPYMNLIHDIFAKFPAIKSYYNDKIL